MGECRDRAMVPWCVDEPPGVDLLRPKRGLAFTCLLAGRVAPECLGDMCLVVDDTVEQRRLAVVPDSRAERPALGCDDVERGLVLNVRALTLLAEDHGRVETLDSAHQSGCDTFKERELDLLDRAQIVRPPARLLELDDDLHRRKIRGGDRQRLSRR